MSLQTPAAAEPQTLESLAQKPRHGKGAKHASGQDKSYKPRSKKHIDLINFQANEVLSRAMKVDVILQDEEALVLDIQMYVLEQHPRLHHKSASARITCDSRMAVGFLTRATCKNV